MFLLEIIAYPLINFNGIDDNAVIPHKKYRGNKAFMP